MKNINTTLLDNARTSIFIAHRLRTIVESGLLSYSLFVLFDTHLSFFFYRSYHSPKRRPSSRTRHARRAYEDERTIL